MFLLVGFIMHILLFLITFTWVSASFGMEAKHDSLESYNMSALLSHARRQASQLADENQKLISLIEQIEEKADPKPSVAFNNVHEEDDLDLSLAIAEKQIQQLIAQNTELKKEKMSALRSKLWSKEFDLKWLQKKTR